MDGLGILTSMEYEPVHSNLLILCNTCPLDQAFLIAEGTECAHEPTVTVIPLANIICRGTVDVELRLLENVLHPLHTHRFQGGGLVSQSHQRVGDPSTGYGRHI